MANGRHIRPAIAGGADRLDRLVARCEHRIVQLARAALCGKIALITACLSGVTFCCSYILVLYIGLTTAVAYTLLATSFYHRDKSRPYRAPSARLRFFLFISVGDCLVCHEEVRDPVLLSCGRLYCAACLAPSIKAEISTCAFCFHLPT